mgnify:CR=1 FL=1
MVRLWWRVPMERQRDIPLHTDVFFFRDHTSAILHGVTPLVTEAVFLVSCPFFTELVHTVPSPLSHQEDIHLFPLFTAMLSVVCYSINFRLHVLWYKPSLCHSPFLFHKGNHNQSLSCDIYCIPNKKGSRYSYPLLLSYSLVRFFLSFR